MTGCCRGTGCASTRKLTFSRTVERRRAALSGFLRGLLLRERRCGFRRTAIGMLRFGRRRDGFGLNLRQRRFGRSGVEIGDRAGCFRNGCRSEFVRDRSGQTILRSAAPPPSAATSATAGSPLAAGRLIGTNRAGLILGFFLVGFAFVGDRVRRGNHVRHNVRGLGVIARGSAFARLAGTTAPPPSPLALVAIRIGFAVALLAGRCVVGQPFGFLGFDLRLDLEGLVLVERLLGLRRESRNLGGEQRLGRLQRMHLFAAIDHERLLAAHGRIGDHGERYLEAVFQIAQMAALVVEDIERHVGSGAHHEIVGRALHQDFLEAAQQLQRHRRDRTHMAAAAALRAGLGRALQHAGANALARHFEQAEMRDAPDLDSGAILPQAIAELAFHRAVIALLVHVDEVDDDQAGEVPQSELPRDLLGGLQIGLERGVLDVMFAGRAAGIDVDRYQRLGLVDHDVAAGPQLHGRREHRIELALDAHPREQRLAVAILPDRAHIRGHQHLHEIAGFLIAGFARDLDFVDFLVVEIAQRTLDQRALFIDQGRRLRLQGHVAHGFPHPDQVLEVTLDLGLGARGAGGAQNDAHAFGHVEILHHFLQPRAILRRGDLAADAAAARGVGHQDGVASGQREVGRQRGALVAALFLDDLDQHDLAALDHFLDLVLPARPEGAFRNFLQDVIAADGFNDVLFDFLAVVVVIIGVFVVRGAAACSA